MTLKEHMCSNISPTFPTALELVSRIVNIISLTWILTFTTLTYLPMTLCFAKQAKESAIRRQEQR